ncbi:MAG: protein-disulfide reductase DsbD domain-containing protein, partial [Brevundimonas sp.]
MSPCLRRLPAFLSSLLTALLGALIAAVPMAALAGVAPSLPTSMTAASPVAPGPREAANLTAELVAMNRWATPGSTTVVALRQQIAPGWHTYWRNPGDSGGRDRDQHRQPDLAGVAVVEERSEVLALGQGP